MPSRVPSRKPFPAANCHTRNLGRASWTREPFCTNLGKTLDQVTLGFVVVGNGRAISDFATIMEPFSTQSRRDRKATRSSLKVLLTSQLNVAMLRRSF